jgi:hypothetical protein
LRGWAALPDPLRKEIAMQLGETIATYDVALALRGESGKFEVTSPTGETFHVTCQPNHSISNLEWSGNRNNAQPFRIRKVAEPIASEQTKGPNSQMQGETTSRLPATPFLLNSQVSDAKSSSDGGLTVGFDALEAGVLTMETPTLDLLYLERDPQTNQPVACVYLKGELRDYTAQGKRPLTAACTNFNELDAGIRRLHAQLDDIRSRARKMFFKSQTVAAGA